MTINTTNPSGVLIIDKPPGTTSHSVVAHIRQIIKAGVKVGHAGTLDPLATGVLIVAVGSATRLLEYTGEWDKTYETTITLGAVSDTDDRNGIRTPTVNSKPPSREELHNIVRRFVGKQRQVPPVYAAIKYHGKKLYEHARASSATQAKSIAQQKTRTITIHQLNITKYSYPHAHLDITCSSGTYIRALARDIGEKLKTGGYVQNLRRTKIGTYDVAQAVKLDQLNHENLPQYLLPPQVLTQQLPAVTLSAANVAQLKRGQSVAHHETLPAGQPIALFDQQKNLIGIGSYNASVRRLSPTKIVAGMAGLSRDILE